MNYEFFLSDGSGKNRLYKRIKSHLTPESKIKIISGFISKTGLQLLIGRQDNSVRKFIENNLTYLIVGKVNLKTYEAFEWLNEICPEKLLEKRIKINLGLGLKRYKDERDISIQSYGGAMIHSKIIALDYNKPKNLFYIGSANLTKPALVGDNAEAGIIYLDLAKAERSKVNSYIDSLSNKESTKSYNSEEAKNALALYATIAHSEKTFLEHFIRINRVSVILCYRPSRIKLEKGDIIYTEITTEKKIRSNAIHGLIKYSTKRYIFFYIFDDIEKLVNRQLQDAKQVICTESSGLIENPVEVEIDAVLMYHKETPPFLIQLPKNNTPLRKGTQNLYQATMTVLNPIDIEPKKYNVFYDPKRVLENKENIIIRERITTKFKATPVNLGRIRKEGENSYIELARFIPEAKIQNLSEFLSLKPISLNQKLISEFNDSILILNRQISKINSKGDLTYIQKTLIKYSERLRNKSIFDFTGQESRKYTEFDDFLLFLAKLPKRIKKRLNLKNYLLVINKLIKDLV